MCYAIDAICPVKWRFVTTGHVDTFQVPTLHFCFTQKKDNMF